MMRTRTWIGKSRRWLAVIALMMIILPLGAAWASEEPAHGPKTEETQEAAGDNLLYISAALCMGLAAIATAMAQARIGTAGVGAIAEDPKRLGAVIMLLALPETVAILGFVIAYLMIK